MKVSELPYKRVTLEEIKAVMDDVLARTLNTALISSVACSLPLLLSVSQSVSTPPQAPSPICAIR